MTSQKRLLVKCINVNNRINRYKEYLNKDKNYIKKEKISFDSLYQQLDATHKIKYDTRQ